MWLSKRISVLETSPKGANNLRGRVFGPWNHVAHVCSVGVGNILVLCGVGRLVVGFQIRGRDENGVKSMKHGIDS